MVWVWYFKTCKLWEPWNWIWFSFYKVQKISLFLVGKTKNQYSPFKLWLFIHVWLLLHKYIWFLCTVRPSNPIHANTMPIVEEVGVILVSILYILIYIHRYWKFKEEKHNCWIYSWCFDRCNSRTYSRTFACNFSVSFILTLCL